MSMLTVSAIHLILHFLLKLTSLVYTVPQEQDGQPEEEEMLVTRDSSTPTSSALEEMALYSSKRKLRHSRRSLEAAVPT